MNIDANDRVQAGTKVALIYLMTDINDNKPSSVVALHARSRADALERLNRITGLQFDALPESLIDEVGGLTLAQEDGEELIYRALYLWGEQQKGK